ncbi:MAG: oxidoreductase [Pseudotabrizicola sp.]|uniref:oxidoreductase n=1 Tax=Pseudotabrizicola sp. TaxID=2939647 RepID=UPI00271CF745|nr:oxidoreductase [Pseudotabrizicola sp.]MDO9640620.1 oxidoreductase [Pseudotabrizicola sp.]
MARIERRTLLFLSAGALIAAGGRPQTARAQAVDPILLTVHGVGRLQVMRLADLDALPQQKFTTSTIWTTTETEFSGPALVEVLELSGLLGQPLRLKAANDYSIQLPPQMIETMAPIVATRINGQTFGLRDRGPLWLVFPYDADSRFRTERTFAASIWQLTDIRADDAP